MSEDEILDGFHLTGDYDSCWPQWMLLLILLLPTGPFQGHPFYESCSFVLANNTIFIGYVSHIIKNKTIVIINNNIIIIIIIIIIIM